MTQPVVQLRRRGFGETMRRDAWWLPPLGVFVELSSFLAYATWAAFQNANYEYGNYLSPFYSPLIFGPPPHGWFARAPRWLASISPALLILPFPAGFRFTCYYYRGAYYKAFWADPPSCSVGEPRKGYRGENSFPLIVQNIHRYFLYIAVIFLFLLAWDVWKALWFTDPATGRTTFGIGVGTILLAVNVVLLSSYTLGCHSFRHVIGGYLDRLAGRPLRQRMYASCSALNKRHALFAWLSLFSVAFCDVYIRLCSMGVWRDFRII
jgi:hypothetical protein